MNFDIFNNIKKIESELEEKEKQDNLDLEKKNFGKEISKMDSADPNLSQFIDNMKLDRVKHENRLKMQEIENDIKNKKIKYSKKIEIKNKKEIESEKEKKYKKTESIIEKVNKDINDSKFIIGKLVEYLNNNFENLDITPNLKIKVQRTERTLKAFYYGLDKSLIKFNKSNLQ